MDDCSECAKWREKGARFCGRCGRRLEPPEPVSTASDSRSIYWTLIGIGIIASVVVMACNIIYMGIHFGELADQANAIRINFSLWLGVWSYPLFSYSGIWVCVDLILCLVVEAACLGYLAHRLYVVHKSAPLDYDAHIGSGYGGTISLMCVSMILSVALSCILFVLGAGLPDASWMDGYSEALLGYLFTRAGVYEEITDRIILVGIPMAVIGYLVHRDRKSWQYIFGGFGMSRATFVLIIFSAAMFGLSHYDGWGLAKVPNAFIGGVIFGYLYSEYGLHASIIAHTITDTMSSAMYLLAVGWMIEIGYLVLGLIVLMWMITHPRKELLDVKNMSNVPPRIEGSFLRNWERH